MKKLSIIKKRKEILELVEKNKLFIRFIFFSLACFTYALLYNSFLAPYKIVTGGMSGLAIIVNELTGLPIKYFIYFSTIVLLFVSYFAIGKNKAAYTITGSLVYTFMISLTEPLSHYLTKAVTNNFLMILICAIIIGISNGIIYRSGFNTGGSDVLSALLNKYLKIPIGKCNGIINIAIILTGTYLFGIEKTIYATFILTISSTLIDIVMLGVNDSKMIYIKSHKWKELEEYLIKDLKVGVTEIGNKGGMFINKEPTLLVIVSFDTYNSLKQNVLKFDKNAFLSVHDCYSVLNGYNKNILPF